jgi:hypothetical protein
MCRHVEFEVEERDHEKEKKEFWMTVANQSATQQAALEIFKSFYDNRPPLSTMSASSPPRLRRKIWSSPST